jgi:hypothetical protein
MPKRPVITVCEGIVDAGDKDVFVWDWDEWTDAGIKERCELLVPLLDEVAASGLGLSPVFDKLSLLAEELLGMLADSPSDKDAE